MPVMEPDPCSKSISLDKLIDDAFVSCRYVVIDNFPEGSMEVSFHKELVIPEHCTLHFKVWLMDFQPREVWEFDEQSQKWVFKRWHIPGIVLSDNSRLIFELSSKEQRTDQVRARLIPPVKNCPQEPPDQNYQEPSICFNDLSDMTTYSSYVSGAPIVLDGTNCQVDFVFSPAEGKTSELIVDTKGYFVKAKRGSKGVIRFVNAPSEINLSEPLSYLLRVETGALVEIVSKENLTVKKESTETNEFDKIISLESSQELPKIYVIQNIFDKSLPPA